MTEGRTRSGPASSCGGPSYQRALLCLHILPLGMCTVMEGGDEGQAENMQVHSGKVREGPRYLVY